MPMPSFNTKPVADPSEDKRSAATHAPHRSADIAIGSPARDLQSRLAESLAGPRPEMKTFGQKAGFVILASSLCWAAIGLVVSRIVVP